MRSTVGKWRSRFVEQRLEGLYDEPRPGVERTITDDQIEEVVTKTLETTPKGRTHWSTRSMAKHLGLSHSTIGCIWRTFGLQPHRSESFRLSQDPQLVEKVRDVVGLYMNPPDNAVVLCVDEKSQIQALERAQPVLPMSLGQPERQTHDYIRHGTTDLFAALDAATGEVLGKCYTRHRAIEFKKFLVEIEAAVPRELDIHVVLDNLATHKTPAIKRWRLVRGLRAPTGALAIYEPGQFEEVISYLFVGTEKALLFDTGLGIGDMRQVVAELTDLEPIVVNSHTHYDHVGGNHHFSKVHGTETAYTAQSAKGRAHEAVCVRGFPIIATVMVSGSGIRRCATKPFSEARRPGGAIGRAAWWGSAAASARKRHEPLGARDEIGQQVEGVEVFTDPG